MTEKRLSTKKTIPVVSIIIPVYNAEDFLSVCLQSVLDQTFQEYEIICVDDGSTDRSAEIVRLFMRNECRIQLIQISNHGQGYARNLALEHARGKYVLFLDADDYIEDVTLELAVARAERDCSDLVVFDWCYFNPVAQTRNYNHSDPFFQYDTICGEQRYALLNIESYFTVNKLYYRSFLDKFQIRYGEGYLYEDIPFWVKVVSCANLVSLIHSPLYRITVHRNSSTKTNFHTDIHSVSYIKAIQESIQIVEHAPSTPPEARYYLACYFFKKFVYYYFNRVPSSIRGLFLHNFVDTLSNFPVEEFNCNKYLSFLLKRHVFLHKNYNIFKFCIYTMQIYKPKYTKLKKKFRTLLKNIYNKAKRFLSKIMRRTPPSTREGRYNSYLKQSIYEDVILFMGFDHRYTGNSRYLFEEILRLRPVGKKIFFVTDNPLVPLQYRISPNSDRCDRFVARSKIIIFESWIPLKYKKRTQSTWIQLWHGTPLKKMLYDSSESCIYSKNRNAKTYKFKDIERWNYLLVDNPSITSYFHTAFLFPKQKMLAYGYPRVKYLLQYRNDLHYKSCIKENLQIPETKKIVLYIPTWRDYNYKVTDNAFDLSYILDMDKLQQLLGEEYEIIYKDHIYLSHSEDVKFRNYNTHETQELLLIADFLITDYSSVLFDAIAIDLPVILYCNDFDRNEASRGVYPNIWNNLSQYATDDVARVADLIKDYTIDQSYQTFKRHFCYQENQEKGLVDMILEL